MFLSVALYPKQLLPEKRTKKKDLSQSLSSFSLAHFIQVFTQSFFGLSYLGFSVCLIALSQVLLLLKS